MKLVYENSRKPVAIGDKVQTFRGEPVTVTNIIPPHKPESTGRVTVKGADGWDQSFFPGVINAVWIDREDQREANLVWDKPASESRVALTNAAKRAIKSKSPFEAYLARGLRVYGAPGNSKNGHPGRKANGQFDGTARIYPRCPSKPR